MLIRWEGAFGSPFYLYPPAVVCGELNESGTKHGIPFAVPTIRRDDALSTVAADAKQRSRYEYRIATSNSSFEALRKMTWAGSKHHVCLFLAIVVADQNHRPVGSKSEEGAT